MNFLKINQKTANKKKGRKMRHVKKITNVLSLLLNALLLHYILN